MSLLTHCLYLGLTAVALTPNIKVAAVLSSNFYSLFNLFAGFIMTEPQVPGWWIWMIYVNPCFWQVLPLRASKSSSALPFQLTFYRPGSASTARKSMYLAGLEVVPSALQSCHMVLVAFVGTTQQGILYSS